VSATPVDWSAFQISLKLAAWTSLLLLPVGILAGRALAWTPFRGRTAVEAAIMLPLVLPPTVLGYYLLVGLGPQSLVGSGLERATGRGLVFTFEGILVASMIFNIPFAIQPMQRAFEAIPANLREAAWVSGLSSFETFVRVELPLAWPGLVSATALVFAHTLGEFGVILMVGGNIPGETQTLAIAVYDRVQAFENSAAAAMAAVLLAFSFFAIFVVHLTTGRRRRHDRG